MGGDEFERAVVIIMDSFVSEGFICTAHGDVVAVLVPADIYFVTRHAIEVRERAFNGLAVDICPVHESYFQFESKKLLAGFFIPCCSSRNSKNRASSMPERRTVAERRDEMGLLSRGLSSGYFARAFKRARRYCPALRLC